MATNDDAKRDDKNDVVFRRDGEVAYPLRVEGGFIVDAEGADVATTPYPSKIADALNELNEWRTGKRSLRSAEVLVADHDAGRALALSSSATSRRAQIIERALAEFPTGYDEEGVYTAWKEKLDAALKGSA